jgi:hypothetical protein
MKKIILVAGSVAVLVALLGGAAFVAGRLWGQESPQGEELADPLPVAPVEGAVESEAVSLQLEGAPELPQRRPDTMGVFSRREDNRIFVKDNGQSVMMVAEGVGVSTTNQDTQVREVEAVVTNETTVYEDVTQESVGDEPTSGGVIQQRLEPGSVEAIGEHSFVLAWGEKHGDRVVADMLVYTSPPVISR